MNILKLKMTFLLYQRLLILLLLISTWTFAQETKIDSLKNTWTIAQHDTLRILIDVELTNYYRTKNSDGAIYFGERALEVSNSDALPDRDKYRSLVLTKLGLAYGYSLDKTDI